MNRKLKLLGVLCVALLFSVNASARKPDKVPSDIPPTTLPGSPVADPGADLPGDTNEGGGDNEDACGAVLCLAGVMMTGGTPDKCDGYIKKYFLTIGKRHGVFDPTKTLKARANFLKQCKSSNADQQNSVNSKYGKSQGL